MPETTSHTRADAPADQAAGAHGAPLLAVRGVGHRYGETVALDAVDLDVAAGECVALLGPNGAGKTTLVNAIVGLVAPRTGTVRVVGGDPRRAAARRAIGVVQQSVGFPGTLRVSEIVRGAAVRAGRPSSAAGPALVEAGLDDLARRRADKLSGGQQQRLQLAAALATEPDLLVLDEPTEGLDAAARRRFWGMIARRRDRGTGVILTTHLIDEAAAVADRVVVLQHGRVVAEDHPTALTARLSTRTVTVRTELDDRTVADLPGADDVVVDGAHLLIRSTSPERFLVALHDADPTYHDLRVEGASLEHAIVALTETTPEVAA